MNTTKQKPAGHLFALRQFLPFRQAEAIREWLRGEEKEHFASVLAQWAHVVETMPKTYATSGQGMEAKAYLHYFKGSADWYITERDQEPEQLQAFGLACLFGDSGELGYISIEELCRLGVELDLYWKPKSLADIKREKETRA